MKFMGDMIENGYTEKVPSDGDAEPGMTFYINHHSTRHPKKKLRIVFNCSQEYNAESLNKNLLQGPLLTNNLTGVLLRFWQEPVAVTCDIEGMFHQVHINAKHRDLPRFLWWEENDLSKDPVDYRMTVPVWRGVITKLRQLCTQANREWLRGRIRWTSSQLHAKRFLCRWWFEVSRYSSISSTIGEECKGHVPPRRIQSSQVLVKQQRGNQEHPREWQSRGS